MRSATSCSQRLAEMFAAAHAQVLDNTNLVEFLVDIIRPVGNELNKGTRNAGAQGIKISGLMKLGQTKTADGKMTSLQYIVSVVGQHRPHLLQLCVQFKACKDAIRLEFKNIDMALSALKKDIGTITTVLAASKAATPPDEPMLLRFEPFLAAVKVKFDELEERYKAAKGGCCGVAGGPGQMSPSARRSVHSLGAAVHVVVVCGALAEAFKRTAKYLGEDPANGPEILFKAWIEFVEDLLKVSAH